VLQARAGFRPHWQTNALGPPCLSTNVSLSAVRIVSSKPRVVLAVGMGLFVLSFATPNWHLEGMGIGAFVVVPQLVWEKFSEGDVFHDWRMVVLIGSLSLG